MDKENNKNIEYHSKDDNQESIENKEFNINNIKIKSDFINHESCENIGCSYSETNSYRSNKKKSFKDLKDLKSISKNSHNENADDSIGTFNQKFLNTGQEKHVEQPTVEKKSDLVITKIDNHTDNKEVVTILYKIKKQIINAINHFRYDSLFINKASDTTNAFLSLCVLVIYGCFIDILVSSTHGLILSSVFILLALIYQACLIVKARDYKLKFYYDNWKGYVQKHTLKIYGVESVGLFIKTLNKVLKPALLDIIFNKKLHYYLVADAFIISPYLILILFNNHSNTALNIYVIFFFIGLLSLVYLVTRKHFLSIIAVIFIGFYIATNKLYLVDLNDSNLTIHQYNKWKVHFILASDHKNILTIPDVIKVHIPGKLMVDTSLPVYYSYIATIKPTKTWVASVKLTKCLKMINDKSCKLLKSYYDMNKNKTIIYPFMIEYNSHFNEWYVEYVKNYLTIKISELMKERLKKIDLPLDKSKFQLMLPPMIRGQLIKNGDLIQLGSPELVLKLQNISVSNL